MIIFITILIIISAVFLVLVVLAQNPKGGGISGQMGGASTQLMGVKKTGDLLEKLTWGFAISLITLSLIANLVLKPTEEATEEAAPPAETEEQAP